MTIFFKDLCTQSTGGNTGELSIFLREFPLLVLEVQAGLRDSFHLPNSKFWVNDSSWQVFQYSVKACYNLL